MGMQTMFKSWCRDESHDTTKTDRELVMGVGYQLSDDGGGWLESRSPSQDSRPTGAPLNSVSRSVNPGNPNPENFHIKQHEEVGRFAVLLVHYPDCRNYEGDKILVFEDVSLATLQSLTSLDPHFCNSKLHPSPIARFEPSVTGWVYAITFCKKI